MPPPTLEDSLVSLTLLAAFTAAASPSRAGGLDIRLGAFVPSADSNLFRDDSDLYFVSKSDFTGFTGGAEYNVVLAKNVEIGFHVDGYARTVDTSHRGHLVPGLHVGRRRRDPTEPASSPSRP